MNISDFLEPKHIVLNLPVTSKKHLIETLSQSAGESFGLDTRDIFDLLIEREKLGTTGVGSGVAIPHGKHPDVGELKGFFVRTETAIDFDSLDDAPVDLVFLLLAPQEAGAEHLRALACVSRALRARQTRSALRQAATSAKIYAILTGEDA